MANLFGQILKPLFRGIYKLWWLIVWIIGWILDALTEVFFMFGGITNVSTGSNDAGIFNGSTIVNAFTDQDIFKDAYLYLCLIALLLIVVFTIIKIIKQDYFDRSGPRSKAPIFRNIALSFIAFLCIPVVFAFLIKIFGGLAVLVYKAMDGKVGEGIGTLLFETCWSDEAASINRYNQDLYYIKGGDILDTDQRMFNWYNINAFLDYFWVDDLDSLYISDKSGRATFDWYLYLVAGFALILNLFKMCLAMVERIYKLLALYIVAPSPISQIVLDDGDKFKKWKDAILQEAVKVVGCVMSFMLFIMIIKIVKEDINFGTYLFTSTSETTNNSLIDSNSLTNALLNDADGGSSYYSYNKNDSAQDLGRICKVIFYLAGAGAIQDMDAVITSLLAGGKSSMELGKAGEGVMKTAGSVVGGAMNLASSAVGAAVTGAVGVASAAGQGLLSLGGDAADAIGKWKDKKDDVPKTDDNKDKTKTPESANGDDVSAATNVTEDNNDSAENPETEEPENPEVTGDEEKQSDDVDEETAPEIKSNADETAYNDAVAGEDGGDYNPLDKGEETEAAEPADVANPEGKDTAEEAVVPADDVNNDPDEGNSDDAAPAQDSEQQEVPEDGEQTEEASSKNDAQTSDDNGGIVQLDSQGSDVKSILRGAAKIKNFGPVNSLLKATSKVAFGSAKAVTMAGLRTAKDAVKFAGIAGARMIGLGDLGEKAVEAGARNLEGIDKPIGDLIDSAQKMTDEKIIAKPKKKDDMLEKLESIDNKFDKKLSELNNGGTTQTAAASSPTSGSSDNGSQGAAGAGDVPPTTPPTTPPVNSSGSSGGELRTADRVTTTGNGGTTQLQPEKLTADEVKQISSNQSRIDKASGVTETANQRKEDNKEFVANGEGSQAIANMSSAAYGSYVDTNKMNDDYRQLETFDKIDAGAALVTDRVAQGEIETYNAAVDKYDTARQGVKTATDNYAAAHTPENLDKLRTATDDLKEARRGINLSTPSLSDDLTRGRTRQEFLADQLSGGKTYRENLAKKPEQERRAENQFFADRQGGSQSIADMHTAVYGKKVNAEEMKKQYDDIETYNRYDTTNMGDGVAKQQAETYNAAVEKYDTARQNVGEAVKKYGTDQSSENLESLRMAMEDCKQARTQLSESTPAASGMSSQEFLQQQLSGGREYRELREGKKPSSTTNSKKEERMIGSSKPIDEAQIETNREILDSRVENGTLTKNAADAMKAVYCNPTPDYGKASKSLTKAVGEQEKLVNKLPKGSERRKAAEKTLESLRETQSQVNIMRTPGLADEKQEAQMKASMKNMSYSYAAQSTVMSKEQAAYDSKTGHNAQNYVKEGKGDQKAPKEMKEIVSELGKSNINIEKVKEASSNLTDYKFTKKAGQPKWLEDGYNAYNERRKSYETALDKVEKNPGDVEAVADLRTKAKDLRSSMGQMEIYADKYPDAISRQKREERKKDEPKPVKNAADVAVTEETEKEDEGSEEMENIMEELEQDPEDIDIEEIIEDSEALPEFEITAQTEPSEEVKNRYDDYSKSRKEYDDAVESYEKAIDGDHNDPKQKEEIELSLQKLRTKARGLRKNMGQMETLAQNNPGVISKKKAGDPRTTEVKTIDPITLNQELADDKNDNSSNNGNGTRAKNTGVVAESKTTQRGTKGKNNKNTNNLQLRKPRRKKETQGIVANGDNTKDSNITPKIDIDASLGGKDILGDLLRETSTKPTATIDENKKDKKTGGDKGVEVAHTETKLKQDPVKEKNDKQSYYENGDEE